MINLSLNGSGHRQESSVNIFAIFRWSLYIIDIVVIGQLLALFFRNLSLLWQIGFVTNQDTWYIGSCTRFNLVHPSGHLNETVAIRHIKNNDNTVRAFVVRLGDRFESFLTGCVPNLKFNLFVVQLKGFQFKIDANCWLVLASEDVVWVACK